MPERKKVGQGLPHGQDARRVVGGREAELHPGSTTQQLTRMGSGVPGGARDSTASAVKADTAAEVRESGKTDSPHIDKTGGLT